MTKDSITSTDVAKKAGVSQSAVSRYFTPGTSLSEKTAKKVKNAADKLGYRPNVLARSLITGKSKIIGLVVAYLDTHFYTEALEKLSNFLKAEGYHILVFMASKTSGNIEEVLKEILDYQVDGIILASVAMSSDLSGRCQDAGVPVVLFNRGQDFKNVSSVTSDNISGGMQAAKLFTSLGFEKISYLSGWEGASTQIDREFGFVSELKKSGIKLFSREVGNYKYVEAQIATRKMLNKDEYPEAIFVANDHMAFAAMDVIRYEFKLKIPEDISVIGYDDVPPASWSSYSLTTLKQRTDDMVMETVRILKERIEGNSEKTTRIKIDSPLIIRNSTKSLKGLK